MTRTDTLRFAHSLHLNGGALRVEKQHCHIVFAKIQHFEAGSGLTMLGKDAKVATACDQQLTDVAFPNFEPLNDLLEASFRSRLICLQQNIRNDEQHSFILPRLQDSVSQSCLSKAAVRSLFNSSSNAFPARFPPNACRCTFREARSSCTS